MSVRFKLKNDPTYTTVPLDEGSSSIRVGRLKEIMTEIKLGGNTTFGLQLKNEQTGEEYLDDAASVPANASLLIKRVPKSMISSGACSDLLNTSSSTLTSSSTCTSTSTSTMASTAAPSVPASSLSSMSFGAPIGLSATRFGAPIGPSASNRAVSSVPAAATVSMFGVAIGPGASQRAAQVSSELAEPPSDPRLAATSTGGDPRLAPPPKEGEAADVTVGGLIDRDGSIVRMVADDSQFFHLTERRKDHLDLSAVPNELKCPISKRLLRDAVLLPCCGASVCNDAVGQALVDDGSGAGATCVLCQSAGVSIDDIVPNKNVRMLVAAFENDKRQRHA
eukprot:jgi/Chrpa1/11974/Chrysochromulina_OHIO_Genome00003768-RA